MKCLLLNNPIIAFCVLGFVVTSAIVASFNSFHSFLSKLITQQTNADPAPAALDSPPAIASSVRSSTRSLFENQVFHDPASVHAWRQLLQSIRGVMAAQEDLLKSDANTTARARLRLEQSLRAFHIQAMSIRDQLGSMKVYATQIKQSLAQISDHANTAPATADELRPLQGRVTQLARGLTRLVDIADGNELPAVTDVWIANEVNLCGIETLQNDIMESIKQIRE